MFRLALAFIVFCTSQSLAQTPAAISPKILTYTQDLYRALHAQPELSFQEKETSQRMAAELAELGFDVTQGVGGYGLFGVLENGEGPTLLIRADMDALPVKEATGLNFASTKTAEMTPGNIVPVMHACGHDLHMANLVGTAMSLVARKEEWSGTLVLIAQPAEERGAGAKAMLSDGLFKRIPMPDYNLALHVSADLPAGTVGLTSGYAMANVDSVDIKVRGTGGHGAYPHVTQDPIVIASKIVLALQTLVSREISPLEAAVVTVGAINGGFKHNVIPAEVDLQLTVRSYSDGTRMQLLEGIKRIAKGEAIASGIAEDNLPIITVKDEYTPSVYNNPNLSERALRTFKSLLGDDKALPLPPVMGGEDFARYGRTAEKIPSLLFGLGAVNPKTYEKAMSKGKTLPSLHSEFFAPDYKPTLETGISAMTALSLELLAPQENLPDAP